jgi:hypothetical protein
MSDEAAESPIDDLVRQYLERRAATVDARQMLRSVQARLAPPRRLLVRRWGVLAAAAAVLVAFGVWTLNVGHASAEELLRHAQETHRQAVDRCYRVTAEVEGGRFEAWQKEARLWTRGNEFWIESTLASRKLAWGQDRQGRMWMAPRRQPGIHFDKDLGFRFDKDRAPELLVEACAIRGLQIDTLLGEVLADFALRWDETSPAEPGARRVQATPRGERGVPRLRAVTLEIDEKSHVIRRAIVERELPRVRATVTFTLIDSQPQPDNAYQLEGHLEPGGNIISNPMLLQRLLSELARRASRP